MLDATPSRLARLLRPQSIAVIGGGVWGASIVEQCRKIGFEGPVWPVHPTKSEIAGARAVASVADLPEAPDAAYISVNRHETIKVVRALAALGAGGAVCFASGFRESEDESGKSLETELLAAAGDMPILGPNCYGFVNYLDRVALWPDQHGGVPVAQGVAIVSQTSNVAINLTMQTRGLPLAFIATVGNQAQTGMAEIASEMLRDPRVTALGLLVEGFGEIRAMEKLAAGAIARDIPIVALKTGRSAASRAAAITHTAALAGEDAGAAALMARLGIARVDTLSQFLESLKLIHVHSRLSGRRIASLSCSGGEAGLVADAGGALGIQFPDLGAARRETLKTVLGPLVSLANPLDYHTFIWRDGAALREVFSAMSGPEFDLTAIVLDLPRADRCDPDDWDLPIDMIRAAATDTGRPYAVLASLPETMPEDFAARLMADGIAPLSGLDDGLAAIAAAATPEPTPAEPVMIAPVPIAALTLTEAEAKQALADHGVPVPTGQRAYSADAAAAAAEEIGFPVVLKGLGAAHKSEAGLVALDLRSADTVSEAASEMASDSYLVEEMITGGVAELLVGVLHDPAHGYILSLGAGGTLTELIEDRATLLVPASRDDIRGALAILRIHPMLMGFRGKPAADIDAIIDTVMAVQDYVAANAGAVAELEINPLICTPGRAVAADALIVVVSRKKEPADG